jgi:hypothetical protein
MEKELKAIWRIYPGDTGLLKTPTGKEVKITMSDDKTHAIVEFDASLYNEAQEG